MTEPAPALRYAVLHHTLVTKPHYDLLLEASAHAPLLAWRCESWPPESGSALERLPDHRRIYLEYEGPISGGRGEVKRVAGGVIHHLQATEVLVQLRIDCVDNLVELRRVHADRWLLNLA